ncbi:hypothetical protein AX15_005592 [Amanita polypyramis BW_CC]|nr:hypothetical protein AX15_005592 [Amanita polypyramis BW_CC]
MMVQHLEPGARGRDNSAQKPIGKAKLVKNGQPIPETQSYLRSITLPDAFKNPDPAIGLPRTIAPEQNSIKDITYKENLTKAIAPPSQDDLEEHQNFLSTIYQVIEAKLAEEEGIFVASDAEIRDQKWSPLAPKADIPSADVISQDWAEDHTHSEFLREQARLNSYTAGAWRVLWTANPPDKKLLPEYYKTWSQLDDYCRNATQTWYNIRFKELKEDTAEALDLDPINIRNIKTSTEWLADELEAAGKSPAYVAQQAVLRAELVASSKTSSRIQSPVIEVKIPASIRGMTTPKARSKSADAIIRSHPSTPDRDTTMPTPRQSSDIMSLEYIDEPVIKQESMSLEPEELSTVIVNPAPIRHRDNMVIDKNTKPSIYKGKFKEAIEMDTSEDLIQGNLKMELVAEKKTLKENLPINMDTTEDFSKKESLDISYYTAPSTLSAEIRMYTKDITPLKTWEDKFQRSHTPLQTLSNGKPLWDFMDVATQNLSSEDMIEFHKELDRKGYSARSAYLEVMLHGLFKEVIDEELHQGHYNAIKDVYDNFNNPLEMFEDQVESVEKDKTLFAILPYELYGDLLVHWLVLRKYIKQAINIPSDGSMEKITWSYLNALFDHRFNDTLSEKDFLHCVKGLHGILEKDIQKKYDISNFGKEGINASIHTPATEKVVEKIVEKIVYVEKESGQPSSSNSTPSLLQQRKMKNRNSTKSSSYDKDEVKNILTMVSQLSDKLDIPITEAFDKAEEILSLTQSTGRSTSRSRSRSRGRQPIANVQQQPWYTSDPQKVTELANMIKALLDAKPKALKKKVPTRPPPKSDKLLPVSLGSPTDDYNNMMAKQQASASSSQQDRVRWAPTPQIACIDEIVESSQEGELQYPPASLESQIAREQAKNKNRSRPLPPSDSLAPYEEVISAESWQNRSAPVTQSSPPTAELSSYAAAAKRFYEKLPTPEWVEVRRKKAQAAIRPATKPNQFFLQDVIEHQDNWDIVMDKTKLVYAEWTASNALLLTTDLPLSQDQQGLYRSAVAHYLEQEVAEINMWDGKVFSEDNLLRIIQADKLWKNAEIFGKLCFIKPKHVDTLPPVATVLIDIKDTKKGEDAKALIGSTVVFNGQHCRWGHTKFICRTTFVTCARCGDNHPTDSHVLYCGDCLNGGNCECITCVNCRGNGNDSHSALDTDCPFRRAQNNRDAMRTLMEGYRERKAKRIEENAYAREQQKKEAEKVAKKKGISVKDLRAMIDNVKVVKGREAIKPKTGLLGKTTARKSAAQAPAARLILKPGEVARVEGVTIKKPKFGKPCTPLPKGMDIDNPININSSPSEGSSASKNLDPHV